VTCGRQRLGSPRGLRSGFGPRRGWTRSRISSRRLPAGRGADRHELLAVVEAEHQARDPGALLAPGDAYDDAVGGLLALHLEDAVTRPREVGQSGSLRDHPVEARDLEPVEPALCDGEIAGRRRDRERKLLDAFAPLLERQLVHGLAVPEEDIEGDEVRGDFRGELLHPALCGMEAHLQRVEVESAVALDDDLAVQGRARREPLAELLQLREITEERSAVTTPEMQFPRHVLEDAAKAVPFRLVLPAVPPGQLVDEFCLHRRKGELGRNRRRHRAV